jgi:hypothetical protein
MQFHLHRWIAFIMSEPRREPAGSQAFKRCDRTYLSVELPYHQCKQEEESTEEEDAENQGIKVKPTKRILPPPVSSMRYHDDASSCYRCRSFPNQRTFHFRITHLWLPSTSPRSLAWLSSLTLSIPCIQQPGSTKFQVGACTQLCHSLGWSTMHAGGYAP